MGKSTLDSPETKSNWARKLGTLVELLRNRRLVAAGVMVVVLFTLALDVASLVHPCPYCRTQRAALGILSLLMLFGLQDRLFGRYIALLAGAFGLIVGVTQNFNHLKKINNGSFDWSAISIGHPWILSGLAVFALTWMLMLIFRLDTIDAAPEPSGLSSLRSTV